MTIPFRRSTALIQMFVALLWLAVAGTVGGLIAYRAILHSSIADLLEFQDVPLLWSVRTSYDKILWGLLATGLVLFLVCTARLIQARRTDAAASGLRFLPYALLLFVGLASWSCRFQTDAEGFAGNQLPVGLLDWCIVLLALPIGWWLAGLNCVSFADSSPIIDTAATSTRRPFLVRLCVVYLCCLAGVVVYGVIEHLEFWDFDRNGGFDYISFFTEEEIESANIVMFTTTVLFASIAALVGCVAYLAMRRFHPSDANGDLRLSRQIQLCSLLIVLGWTLISGLPWQIVILPEIRAEQGWILPATVICMLMSNLLTFVSLSFTAIVADVRQANENTTSFPRLSEFVLWATVLFPVYPLLRLVTPRRRFVLYTILMLSTAALIIGFIAAVNFVDEWFEFEDWRGMLRTAQLPALQVFVSMLGSFLVYVACGRLLSGFRAGNSLGRSGWWWRGISLATRVVVSLLIVLIALACLVVAAFPFWGWDEIPENVFARLSEFHSRHSFELSVLHSLVDCDRDGYAALLHGADTDDFNSDVQAGGLQRPRVVPLPLDHFVANPESQSRETPNVLILYLEGVIPRAISCYGERRLPHNRIATPHMDSVARDGTLFRQARCYYPSTWDAWFAVNTGRYLHVSEMNNSLEFGDRYTRYNNLYSVLRRAGVDRWCHADCSCYSELFVPQEMLDSSKTAWQPHGDEKSTAVSAEEDEQDIWLGDKRNTRILEFIDDLQPQERFFICEHMSDSHFPWNRTSDERAREMGFPDGLSPYEADATLPTKPVYSARFARYLQTVTRVDWQIGQILDKLKQRGLYDNTLIVIVSDHGCQWWEHEHLYYVSHLYEQSLLVPLIVKIPGGVGGQENSDPVLQVDLLPTIMEYCGFQHDEKQSRRPLNGISLLSILQGVRDPQHSRRLKQRTVPLMTHYDTLGLIHEFRHKLIFDRPTGAYWLFNIEDDPLEMNNLADSDPALLQDMQARLREYARENPEFIGEIQRSTDP